MIGLCVTLGISRPGRWFCANEQWRRPLPDLCSRYSIYLGDDRECSTFFDCQR
jgi:hypothetical protein